MAGAMLMASGVIVLWCIGVEKHLKMIGKDGGSRNVEWETI